MTAPSPLAPLPAESAAAAELMRQIRWHLDEAARLGSILASRASAGAASAPAELIDLSSGEYLTTEQAAFAAKCSPSTIARRIAREPELSVMMGGRRLVRRSVLLRGR